MQLMSFINKGYEGQVVGVEADVRSGFPGFDIVGLPDSAVKEARERVKCAIRNSGLLFPKQRVLVNLSPASQPKSGTGLDLAIALALLIPQSASGGSQKIMAVGELSLTGAVMPGTSALGAVTAGRKAGCSLCLAPHGLEESDGTMQIRTAASLQEALHICTTHLLTATDPAPFIPESLPKTNTFSGIIGLSEEKEALCLSAAGFHGLLMFGPPGVGKTMLAGRLEKLLPPLTAQEATEVNRIYGCASIERPFPLLPPSRYLAHDCSMPHFIGSNNPGEGSLAHQGVLILDEITSFSKKLLDGVRETYDRGSTISSRSGQMVCFPAVFLPVGTMNPCSCGALGNPNAVCSCSPSSIINHWKKVGSPLTERFDIRLPVQQVDIFDPSLHPSKDDIYYKDKINAAVSRQRHRYQDFQNISRNGQVHLNVHAQSRIREEIDSLVFFLNKQESQSARWVISTAALARTLADLEDRESCKDEDFLKAIELRHLGSGDYYWRKIER